MSEKQKYEYLSVLKKINKELDPQQENACCRTINSVVAAGAGSGKTQVLATRFAWLLMEDENLHASNILTLTYTKKAAAEMYSRIYKTLKLFSSSEEVPLKKRENAARALKEFSSVHIQTMDSYCTSVLRQCANRYGIRPDFSSGSSDSSSEIENLAFKFVLQNLDKKCIGYFSSPTEIQDFAEKTLTSCVINFTSLASPKNYFSSFIPKQKKHIVEKWNFYASCQGEKNPLKIILNIHDLLTLDENKAKALSDPKYSVFIQTAENLNLKKLEETDLEKTSLDQTNEYAKKIFSQIKDLPQQRNLRKKLECQDELKALFGELEETLDELEDFFAYIKDFKYLEEFCALLDEFTQTVNKQKRESGNLSFKDVSELAIKILIEQKDIREQEKAAYKKIMIDEFQDNNGKNRDLLFLLAEKDGIFTEYKDYDSNPEGLHQLLKNNLCPEKLFFVGDEKQSIYKFRGAEVDVFNNLKELLRETNGDDSYCSMIYNYRSKPELLTSFNILFGALDSNKNKIQGKSGIFENSQEKSYEAGYESANFASYVDKFHKEMPALELNEKNVKGHIAILLKNQEFTEKSKNEKSIPENPAEHEAYFLARQILNLKKQKVPLSKIAILDKKRTDRHYFTRALERFNIPYKLDQMSKVFSDGIVNDIYNFLRLCVYPSDINAFSAYLCSPLCGLSIAETETVLSCMDYIQKKNDFTAFDENFTLQIQNAFAQNECAFLRYKTAAEFFKQNKVKFLCEPLTQVLTEIWYSQGYRYETLINTNVNVFEEHYDLLFELARECDSEGKNIAWFIDQLSIQKEKEKSSFASGEDSDIDLKNLSYPLEESDAVQIMTVHKSKGLQFDYVFLLGCYKNLGNGKSHQEFFDDEYGYTMLASSSKNFFEEERRELLNNKELAEYRRLIYVGITRAIKEFTIIGTQDFDKDNYKIEEKNLLQQVLTQYYDLDSLSQTKNEVSGESEEDFDKIKFVYETGAPFDFCAIPFYPKKIIYQEKNIPLDTQKFNLIKRISPVYETLEKDAFYTEETFVKKISPSDLENAEISSADEGGENAGNENAENASQKALAFSYELDSFLAPLIEEQKISWKQLGTFIHLYLENFTKLQNFTFTEENLNYELPEFSKGQREKLFEYCRIICQNFSGSELGKKALSCGAKTEYPFKMSLDGFTVNGSIDLFFKEGENQFTIIDYKTDHSIDAKKYAGQQSCYKKALSLIFGVPEENIKSFLYFVRFNKFVDISSLTNIKIDSELFYKILEESKNPSYTDFLEIS